MMKLEKIYSGKAKTMYRTNDPNRLIMEFRDNLTAFDGKKKSELPKKGYYNAQISANLFKLLEERNIQTHFNSMWSYTEMIVESVEMIKIEIIVRNIAAGSFTRIYPFKIGQNFDPPIVVFDYKSDGYRDPMINDDIASALDLATKDELLRIKNTALKVNQILVQYLDKKNILLPDFKLEFGRKNGDIILADEISCDTCRFWDKTTGESLDKDIFRYDKGDVIVAYKEVAKRIIPEIF